MTSFHVERCKPLDWLCLLLWMGCNIICGGKTGLGELDMRGLTYSPLMSTYYVLGTALRALYQLHLVLTAVVTINIFLL